jgi:outer membrane immunogenic protein
MTQPGLSVGSSRVVLWRTIKEQDRSGYFATAVVFSPFETLAELAKALHQAPIGLHGLINGNERVAGRSGLQLTDTAFARRRHGGSFIAGLILLGALSAGAARGADLPSKTRASVFEPPPPAEFSWTGFYLGINAGGGLDHFAFPFDVTVPGQGGLFQSTNGITASGPIGGIQAGFNYELPFFHIVAGIEIDNSASGIRGETTVNGTLLSGVGAAATFGSKFEDFGTARLRLGYAWGRLMPYMTAGFIYGTIETFYSVATPGFFSAGANTAIRSGVFPHVGAAGCGFEYAITPNFTVKVEYLYDFINARPVVFNPAPGSNIQFSTRTMYHIARVGLNYKFDWLSPLAAPVVAKY